MKRAERMIRRLYRAVLLAALLAGVLISAMLPAAAADSAVPSLTVIFEPEDKPVEGMTFRAYRIGVLIEDTQTVEMVEPFSHYPLVTPKTAGGWRIWARTMEGYVGLDEIPATYAGDTDENGRLDFGEVEEGVYLILADAYLKDGVTYFAEPGIAFVPMPQANGSKLNHVEMRPKHSLVRESYEPIEWSVLKVWENTDGIERPASIEVVLLCDGEEYERVTLSRENNWRHTFENLDETKTWTLSEPSVPEGYTVTVGIDGATFVVTNTYTPEELPPEVPPTTPPTTPPSAPPKTPPSKPKLPQTGQDWRVAIALAAAGLALIAGGIWAGRYQR